MRGWGNTNLAIALPLTLFDGAVVMVHVPQPLLDLSDQLLLPHNLAFAVRKPVGLREEVVKAPVSDMAQVFLNDQVELLKVLGAERDVVPLVAQVNTSNLAHVHPTDADFSDEAVPVCPTLELVEFYHAEGFEVGRQIYSIKVQFSSQRSRDEARKVEVPDALGDRVVGSVHTGQVPLSAPTPKSTFSLRVVWVQGSEYLLTLAVPVIAERGGPGYRA